MEVEISTTYAQSLSESAESGLSGAPGKNVFLKPGPTIRSVEFGNDDGLPM
jgi:hypothetical protein